MALPNLLKLDFNHSASIALALGRPAKRHCADYGFEILFMTGHHKGVIMTRYQSIKNRKTCLICVQQKLK